MHIDIRNLPACCRVTMVNGIGENGFDFVGMFAAKYTRDYKGKGLSHSTPGVTVQSDIDMKGKS
jgi:hypothetical protein